MQEYQFTKIRQQVAREALADIEQTVHQQVTPDAVKACSGTSFIR